MMTTASPRAQLQEWIGLAVLTLPTALLGLDVTLLYLVLPALAADLQPTNTQALWIMDAYGFLIAGCLITMGTLGDRIGRRRLLMIGATAFGIVSVLAAYATSPGILIAARALLGIAGATLMPSTLALITNMFVDAHQRALAIGVWATAFSLGMVAGPLVGGALLAQFWWGAAFLVALPVVGILLLAAPFCLPEFKAPHSGRFDLGSVALSLAAILQTIYALKHLVDKGVTFSGIATLLAGVAFGLWFVRRQHRLATPLLDMRLFHSPAFNAALGILLIGLMSVGGIMLLVTQYLQLVADLTPMVAGMWMAPPALAMFIAALTAPLMVRRFPASLVVAGTLTVSTLGYLLLASVDGPTEVMTVVVGFSLVYLGLGAIAALGTDLVVGSAPPEMAGAASAMSETVQELGVALGVAILGSLTTLVYRLQLTPHRPNDLPPDLALKLEDGLWGASSIVQRLSPELLIQAKQAFIAGMNLSAMVAGAGILTLALLSALWLRSPRPQQC
ncbi:MFS transporter [Halomonas eurihalina]|uniref:MFS transporter n=1 Tax=Halomonas eurihalina TaxID=42566 RepID=A0A5D9DEF6_HALER|nr:MFS transporter [Halomonas eurihalina]MDR5858001.1 MFS transporter [Halomonas eurihalina]TZG41490.1 MFS transporter [Halomonas eurihalina]